MVMVVLNWLLKRRAVTTDRLIIPDPDDTLSCSTNETPNLADKGLLPLSLCPPQITEELLWDRNRILAVSGSK